MLRRTGGVMLIGGALIALTACHELDQSFGDGGHVTTDIGGPGAGEGVEATAIDSTGRIVVVGWTSARAVAIDSSDNIVVLGEIGLGQNDFLVARYLAETPTD